MASTQELRSDPDRSFLVGGRTWDEKVRVQRVGMSSPTGEDTYSVFLSAGNESRAVFDSSSADTGVTIDGWKIDLSVTDGERAVTMEREGERRRIYIGRQPTVVEGVTFEVNDRRVVASQNETSAVVGNIDGARRGNIR